MTTDMKLKQKFAEIEADLVAAHALGMPHLHAEAYSKFAALDMDEGDLEAVVNGLIDEQEKVAFLGGMIDKLNDPGVGRLLTLGAVLAPPLMTGAGMLLSKMKKDGALNELMRALPAESAANPERVKALFSLLYSTAPTVATNTIVAADLVKQMMAMPMIDMGAVSKLIEMAKVRKELAPGPNPLIGMAQSMGGAMTKLQSASLKPNHVASDGTLCLLDWSTEACKTAGITDAFQGSGTSMEQANNAFQNGQNQNGSGLLPLDNVVKELLAKEQELSQREEILAQQEAQFQQMIQMMQGMGSQYQEQTGVDPNTGDVIEGEDDQMPEGDEGQMPEGAEGQMPEGEMPEGAEGQMPEGEMPEGAEGQMPEGEMPEGADGETPEGAEGQMPEGAEGEMPEGAEGDPAAQQPGRPQLPLTSPDAPAGEAGIDAAQANPPYSQQGEPDGDEGQPGPGDGDGDEGQPVEGEDDEHDQQAIADGLAAGPVQPEDVEGTPEDEMHDRINNVEEGTPEDETADAELAAVMNAGGHTPGEHLDSATPVAVPAGSATGVQPSADGGHEITLPLRVSIKIGEAEVAREHEARANAKAALVALFEN